MITAQLDKPVGRDQTIGALAKMSMTEGRMMNMRSLL